MYDYELKTINILSESEVENVDERFDQLFQMYSSDVYRLAYSYVLNRSDAEDVVQRVFYNLYKNTKIMYLSLVDVKKWLFRVSSNECKNFLKSSWIRKTRSLDEENLVNVSKEKSKNLFEMLGNVSKECRITLYLYYYEGYNIEEIAKIIGKSASAVKMRLSRGRDQLKIEMEGSE